MVHCVICGKERQPNPDKPDDWRILETARGLYALCPNDAPADSLPREARRQAYIAIFRQIMEVQPA
jgi:hypothetical protein